MIEKREHL